MMSITAIKDTAVVFVTSQKAELTLEEMKPEPVNSEKLQKGHLENGGK